MKIVPEMVIKTSKHEWPLLDKLEKYAKSKTDQSARLDFSTKIIIRGDERRCKGIDAIWKRGDFTYIIEAKPELNYEAIGQVYAYEYLYQKMQPEEITKKAIVCREPIDQDLLSFCSEKDITVFALTKNGIHEHIPNAI